jgi:uncharacterized membrane protein
LFLAGGFALKGQCLQPWTDYHQYSSLCYNDIQPLWGPRGVAERIFPYIHGELANGELSNGAIEYPVLTGVFMWASGTNVADVNRYLVQSALLLAPFGTLTAYLLARISGLRALFWAAAPALVLYAFHNWDLLVVAAAVAGFWFWWQGRPIPAAICFGVGGALKLYPLFFLGPVFLQLWRQQGKTMALRVLGTGVGTFALVNIPFAIANPEGWWATYEFHRQRGPNFDNIWAIEEFRQMILPSLEPGPLNLLTGGLTASFFIVALVVGLVRARREGSVPVVAISAALLVAFLLWNKVHSPQYTLWLLPFFVLLDVSVLWWIAYSIIDLMVYVGVFRFFYDVCSANACQVMAEPTFAQNMMRFGVLARAALLGVLFFVFLRARSVQQEGVRGNH